MTEKRKPIKRKGKQPHKKLNMKEKHTKRPKQKVSKTNKTVKSTASFNQMVNQFKANGLTLLKGKKGNGFKLNYKLVLFCLATVLVIVIVGSVFNAPTGIVEYISAKTALSKSGDSFPVSYDFNANGDITYSNGSVFVSTETDLKCYNKTGNLIYSRIHGFAQPIIKTSKVRTLVYGINNSNYKIENAEKEIFSKKTENNASIICADISDCGVYAIATEANEDVAIVSVYDKNGNEIYKYHSANKYVSGVTVSENGNKICIVTLSTDQAEFVSTLSVYDLDSTKVLAQTELKGEVVYSVEYSDSNNICVITDKQYFNLKDEKASNHLTYNPEFLNKFEISDDYILIYNTADSNSQKGNIYVLSKKGKVKAEFEIDGNISDISVSKGRVYTLESKVNEYNFKGKLIKSTEISNGGSKISACPSGVMVLYSSGVDFIKEG